MKIQLLTCFHITLARLYRLAHPGCDLKMPMVICNPYAPVRWVILSFMVGVAMQVQAQDVDQLTGRLKMAIPVGSLSANDISIPISIVNNGGSIRVAEGEGSCGVGWNLSVGGGVHRIVRGLPDGINTADRKGWLFRTGSVQSASLQTDDGDLSNWTDEVTDYNTLEALHSNYTLDTEPDVFTASAPGLFVQFVLEQNGTPRLLNYVDVDIKFLPDVQTMLAIEITTNNGFKYTFGGTTEQLVQNRDNILNMGKVASTQKMNTQASYIPVAFMTSNVGYCYNWKLFKIYSIASGTEATFYYRPYQNATYDAASKRHLSIDSSNYVLDLYRFTPLDYIKLKSFKAKFSWGGNNLRSVLLTDTVSQDQQKVDLTYFTAYTGGSKSVTKQFLKQVNRIGTDCQRGESHAFEYEGVVPTNNYAALPTMNWYRNSRQDYFGYYNGQSGNWNNPTLFFAAGEIDGRRLRVHPISGASYTSISGNDRIVTSSANFGALKKIIFPAGGYALIAYESNKYLDTSVSPSVTYDGPGVRVQKITLQAGEAAYGKTIADVNVARAIEKEYIYTLAGSSTTSGIITSPIKLGYVSTNGVERVVNNLGDEPTVLYSRTVEKIAGKGYTVYEFGVPGVFPETATGSWKATKSRVARNSNVPANDVKNGFYLFPYAPSTNYDFKRGQLTRVATYNEGDVLLQEKTLTYISISVNPLTLKGVRFEKLKSAFYAGSVYYYGVYEILTGQSEFLLQEVVKQASIEDPTKLLQTTTSYVYNANKMLSTVTTTLPNSTTSVKTIKYARDFPFANPTDNEGVAIKLLNDTYRGSSVIEEYTTVTAPGSPIAKSAQIILYKVFGNQAFPSYVKSLLPGATHTPASMSGNAFTYSASSYRTVSQILDYEEGRPRTVMDDNMNTGSTHYALNTGLPVASFYNCRAQQSVFDNFESTCSFGLAFQPCGQSCNPGAIVKGGRTGERSAVFTSSSQVLKSSSTNLIEKKEDVFRVSCWVKAPNGRQVTFAIKSETSSIGQVITVSLNNQWEYFEQILNVGSSNAGPFWLEVTTNGTDSLRIDDVVLVPSSAKVTHQTALPFKGITSSTDDRGFSSKTTYDYLGRPLNTLDRNRNLINRKEYSIKNALIPTPNAIFESVPKLPENNESVTFTPSVTSLSNCDTNLTYAWEVDGVSQSSDVNGVMNYTFETAGLHTVKFTATSSLYGSAGYTQTYCINQTSSVTVSTSVTNSSGQPAGLSIDCNSGIRNLNVILPSVPPGCLYTVTWTKNGITVGSGPTLTITPIAIALQGGSTIEETYVATVTLDCSGFSECAPTMIVTFEGSESFAVFHLPADCE